MQAVMLLAGVIAICVLVFLVALLRPRLSRPVYHGASQPLGLGGRAAGEAPPPPGRGLRSPRPSAYAIAAPCEKPPSTVRSGGIPLDSASASSQAPSRA